MLGIIIKILVVIGALCWMLYQGLKWLKSMGGRYEQLAEALLSIYLEVGKIVGKAFIWSLIILLVYVVLLKIKLWYFTE